MLIVCALYKIHCIDVHYTDIGRICLFLGHRLECRDLLLIYPFVLETVKCLAQGNLMQYISATKKSALSWDRGYWAFLDLGFPVCVMGGCVD